MTWDLDAQEKRAPEPTQAALRVARIASDHLKTGATTVAMGPTSNPYLLASGWSGFQVAGTGPIARANSIWVKPPGSSSWLYLCDAANDTAAINRLARLLENFPDLALTKAAAAAEEALTERVARIFEAVRLPSVTDTTQDPGAVPSWRDQASRDE